MLFTALPFMKAGGMTFPAATLTSAHLYGAVYGFASAGGYVDTNVGPTGGSLSTSLLSGQTTTDVVDIETSVLVYFAGDITSMLSGVTHVKVDGVNYAKSAVGLDGAFTVLGATTPDYVLTAGAHTIQLV